MLERASKEVKASEGLQQGGRTGWWNQGSSGEKANSASPLGKLHDSSSGFVGPAQAGEAVDRSKPQRTGSNQHGANLSLLTVLVSVPRPTTTE